MTEPVLNRSRNRFHYRTPNHALNRCGTRGVTTDQSQSQIQTVVTSLVVVSGLDQIQSDRHLGPLAAPIGFGAMA